MAQRQRGGAADAAALTKVGRPQRPGAAVLRVGWGNPGLDNFEAGQPRPLTRRPDGCQWPVSDAGPLQVCGLPLDVTSSYCPEHHQRARIPPKRKPSLPDEA